MLNEESSLPIESSAAHSDSIDQLVISVKEKNFNGVIEALNDPELQKSNYAWRALLQLAPQSDEEGMQAWHDNKHDPNLLVKAVVDNPALLRSLFDPERGSGNQEALVRIVSKAAEYEQKLADKDVQLASQAEGYEKQIADITAAKNEEIERLTRELPEAKSASTSVAEPAPQEPSQTWGKVVSRIPDDSPSLSSSGDEENTAVQNAFDPNGPLPEPEREPAVPGMQKFEEALKTVEAAYSEANDGDLTQIPLPNPNAQLEKNEDAETLNDEIEQYKAKVRELDGEKDASTLTSAQQILIGMFETKRKSPDDSPEFNGRYIEMLDLAQIVDDRDRPVDERFEALSKIDDYMNTVLEEQAKKGETPAEEATEPVVEQKPEPKLEIIENKDSPSLQKVIRGKQVSVTVQLLGTDPAAPQYTAYLLSEDGDKEDFGSVNEGTRTGDILTLRLNNCDLPKKFGTLGNTVKIVIEDGNREVESKPIPLV